MECLQLYGPKLLEEFSKKPKKERYAVSNEGNRSNKPGIQEEINQNSAKELMGTMKKIVDTLIDMESNDVSKRSEVAEKHGF